MSNELCNVTRHPLATERSMPAATDVTEHETEFQLIVEMPGLEREQVEISVENRHLTVRGENAAKTRAYSREFRLSAAVDPTSIHAEMDRGLLTLHLPKAASEVQRNIPISNN